MDKRNFSKKSRIAGGRPVRRGAKRAARTRKMICLALVFSMSALLFSAVFAAPAFAAAFYKDVRVLISTGLPKSLSVTIEGEYALKEAPEFIVKPGEAVIEVRGARPVLKIGESEITSATLTLQSRDYGGISSGVTLKNSLYGSCKYLGNICFDVSEGGIRAINTLPIEQYLYGVVPYEMSNTFPIEALKAQAVCARGYVTANCSAYSSRSYDVLDTSADQVYHGYMVDYTRAIAAVDDTKGQVLTYENDIIQAYYAASNGGQTELTGNVWKSDLPYYIQSDDAYDLQNPSSMEEKSFIPSEFTDETRALMDESVLALLEAGADEAAGEDVSPVSTVRIKAHTAKYAPPSRLYTMADVVLTVKKASGEIGQVRVTLSLEGLVKTDENSGGIFNTHGATLRMRGAEQGVLKQEGREYGGWFLTNRRYGHGIGMSQRGAQQRATGGISYADVLSFYYVGTELCTVGGLADAPALTGGGFAVSDAGITGVSPGTGAAELLADFSAESGSLAMINSRGALKTEGSVATGDFLRLIYAEGKSYLDLPIVIFGDADGSGSISAEDAQAINRHLLGEQRISGAFLAAADADRNGIVDIGDVAAIYAYINGDRSIEQGEKTE